LKTPQGISLHIFRETTPFDVLTVKINAGGLVVRRRKKQLAQPLCTRCHTRRQASKKPWSNRNEILHVVMGSRHHTRQF